MRRSPALFLVVSLCACVEPTNPYDSDTPPDQQARGSLTGSVALEDESAPPDVIASEVAALRVVLLDEEGKRLRVDGQDRAASLVDVSERGGAFFFDDLVPGRYTPLVENVGARYAPPASVTATVAPGADVDLGELRFVARSVAGEGGGPGVISGEVELLERDGGARTVSLYRLGADEEAAELVTTRLTDSSGRFQMSGLSLGTYALVASLRGFTPDHALDLKVGETEGASLVHNLSAGDALTLHPVTAVLRPVLPLVEGHRYVSGDEVAVDVLAFGGVTGMRLATDESFLDDEGEPLPFVTHSASVTVPLPAREGPIELFGQFEVRSEGGFAFTSEVFSTTVIRDVTPPVVVGARFLGVQQGADGTYLANLGTGSTLTLSAQLQDAVSAVSGIGREVTAGDEEPSSPAFTQITSFGGLLSWDEPIGLGDDGLQQVWIYARDRAGNVSEPEQLAVLLDRSVEDLPLQALDATGGTLPVRLARLSFDEDGAAEDLPVAMQIGVAPLALGAEIVPYEQSPVVFVDPELVSHGAPLAFEARLFDRVGNESSGASATLNLHLVSRLAGVLAMEGVPELEASAAGVEVRVVGADGETVASATSDAAAAFALADVAEGEGYTLEVSHPGYQETVVALAPVAGRLPDAPAVSVGTVPLSLARGTVAGRFRLADLTGDAQAHADIAVSVELAGSSRRYTDNTVTRRNGDYSFSGLPATRTGERYLIEARREDYGSASAEVSVAPGTVTVVNPDADDEAIALLLPRNVGDFDVCAPAGGCSPAQYLNTASARVRLRDPTDVVEIRAQARTAFSAGDPLPAFAAFDADNATPIDISGDDGVVDVFVQVKKPDGTTGPVLTATVVKDTVAPTLAELSRVLASGALDERFTKSRYVDLVIEGDPGVGNVAPLSSARAAIADEAPATPPAGAVSCTHGATCRVPLPGAETDSVAEQLHRAFAFACDAAGNCSGPSETFVIYDKTPPADAHGAGFGVIGNGVVEVGGEAVLPSPLYGIRLDVGAARDSLGGAVVDEADQAVADVFAYRFSFAESTNDAQVRALDPTPVASQPRQDVVVPALPPIDGTYEIYAQLVDAAGNVTRVAPNPFAATLRLDTTPPDATFTVNGGDALTPSRDVLFDVGLPAGGEVPARVQVAADGGLFQSGVVERTFPLDAAGEPFSLPDEGDGTYTVYARLFDDAGNCADRSASIVLDTTPPEIVLATCRTCTSTGGQLFSSDALAVLDVIAQDATSQVVELDIAVNGGTSLRVPYSGNATVPLALNESNTIVIRAVDGAGLLTPLESAETLIVLHDTEPPSATLAVTGTILGTQGGDARAALESTTLTRTPFVAVEVSDPSEDDLDIMISNDPAFIGAAYGPLVPGEYAHQLPSGDGSKTVYVKLRDAAGNESLTLEGTLALDTTPPTSPTLLVEGGAAFTRDESGLVDLVISASGAPTEMAFSTTGDFTTPAFEPFATTRSDLSLTEDPAPAGDGLKTVFALFRDAAGNETAAVNDNITLDRIAPAPVADVTCGAGSEAVCIDGGVPFTNSVSVTLAITTSVVPPATSEVDRATEMQIATDGVPDTEPFIPYSATAVALLPPGDCTADAPQCKSIAVRFRDAAGNASGVVSDAIGLDSTRPSAPRIANPPAVTKAPAERVELSVQAADAFGVTYQLLGGQYADWTDTADTGSFDFELTAPPSSSAERGDVYNLGVRAVDPAGNLSAEDFVTIICDGNAPSIPAGLAVAERSGSASLRWSRPPAGESDVIGYLVHYGYEPGSLNDDFAAEGPSPIFVPLPNGGADPTLTLTGLTDNTPFHVRVAAIDHTSVPAPNASPLGAPQVVLPNPVAPVVTGALPRAEASAGAIAAKGARLVAMEGSDLCVYDASTPSELSRIACKADASFHATDRVKVFGRYAYLFRPGVPTRAVDVGQLGGSRRADPGAVDVHTLPTDANGVVDMVFFGTAQAGPMPYAAVARNVGAGAELRLFGAPLTGNPLLPALTSSAAQLYSTSTVSALDADLELTAVALAQGPAGIVSLHLTKDLDTSTQVIMPGTSVRDVKVEAIGNGYGRLYVGGDFGLRIYDVEYDAGMIHIDVPPVSIGGLDCGQMEMGAGFLYCTDRATQTADSLVVFRLAPTPRVVGRLLMVNTKAPGADAGSPIAGIALSENHLYATINDNAGSLVAIEVVRPNRYESGASTGSRFEDVVLSRNLAFVVSTDHTSGHLEGTGYNVTDPRGPALLRPSTVSMGGGCDSSAARHARVQLYGRAPVAHCSDGIDQAGTNVPFQLYNAVSGSQAIPARSRPAGNTSTTSSFAIDGHTAYVLTSADPGDSTIEAWSLARPGVPDDGPAAVLIIPGDPSFSRPPAVQDDRLVAVDDAGNAYVVSLAGTTSPTPALALLQGPVDLGAADTTRFGDVEVRGDTVIVTRALTQGGGAGMFAVPYRPDTGLLNAADLLSKARAGGAIAPAGAGLIIADGFYTAPAPPGSVAGVFAVQTSTLNVRTSTQAVLAPYGIAAVGPVVFTVNRDSGLESLLLSR